MGGKRAMTPLKVYTSDGSQYAEKQLSNLPMMEGERGRAALRQCLLAYQANQRQGNACTKNRSEVSGTGKKPWRQKGTGRARAGSRRSPLFAGGGLAFGPRPRDYMQKINRKMRLIAFQHALFKRVQKGHIIGIQQWDIPEPKTRIIEAILKKIAPKGTVLIVDDMPSATLILASRNLRRVTISDAASLNAWDLSRYTTIIMSEKSIDTTLVRAQKGRPS